MKKEYDLKKMKMEPVGDRFKDAKIAKTVRIDLTVFVWLRKEAERTGIPYQTLLNAKLVEAMNQPTLEALIDKKIQEALKADKKKTREIASEEMKRTG